MADGLLVIVLVHCTIDALEAEGGDDFGGYLETFVDVFLLLIGPFAEHEIDLCAAGKFIADTETYTCVRVRS